MSGISWEPIVWIARWPADAVARRAPYRLAVTVQMFGHEAHAHGFAGHGMTMAIWRDFLAGLAERGAKRLHYARPGGRCREIDLGGCQR